MTLEEFGATVERRWRARNYEPAALSTIALALLQEHPAPEWLTPQQLIERTHRPDGFPQQQPLRNATAQASVTVWDDAGRFSIEAQFWLDGSPRIAQVRHHGAFALLTGGSLYSSYSFAVERSVVPQLVGGRLRRERSELLRPGDGRAIVPGSAGICSLFHVERPTVVLVVRGHDEPSAAPAYEYLSPSLAYDPSYREPRLWRQTQLYRVLARTAHGEHLELVRAAMADADLWSCFVIAEQHAQTTPDDDDGLRQILLVAADRHGAWTDGWADALAARRRRQRLLEQQQRARTPEHRFWLSLEATVDDEALARELMSRRFGGVDVAGQAQQWAHELELQS